MTLSDLAQQLSLGKPVDLDQYQANDKYSVLALPPDDWLRVAAWVIHQWEVRQDSPHDPTLDSIFYSLCYYRLPPLGDFSAAQRPLLTAALVTFTRADCRLVASLLRKDLGSAPINLILACMDAQGAALWRSALRFHLPQLELSMFCQPEVWEKARAYYLVYLQDRTARVQAGQGVEPLPYQHYFQDPNAAFCIYFVAIFCPYLLDPELHPEAAAEFARIKRRLSNWELAPQLIPWLANSDSAAAVGDARLTPAVQAALLALYRWPLKCRYMILAACLATPPWVVAPKTGFSWTKRTIQHGNLQLHVTANTIRNPRAPKWNFLRLGPQLCLVNMTGKVTDTCKQTIRVLRGEGLHFVTMQEPNTDGTVNALLLSFVWHMLTQDNWEELNLPAELDPEIHAVYCNYLRAVATVAEMVMVNGVMDYNPDWYGVVSRYLPEYVPSPAMTTLIA